MKSTLFSGRMYKEGLRKTKITAFIFLAYILIVQVVAPLITGLSNGNLAIESVPAVVMAPLFVIPYLWVPIQTLVLFYVFDKRGSSDFYQALPYTRTCLIFSWSLSILTVTIGGLLAGTLAGYLIRLPFPEEYILHLDGLGNALLLFIIAMLFALGCTLIAVSVTGTLLSNIACTLLLMFLPRLIMFTIRSMMMNNMPFLVDGMFLEFFGVRYNLFVGLMPSLFRNVLYEQNYVQLISDIGPMIYTFLLSVCYILIALWLFKRRKSETAGHSASGKIVKSIVLTAIGFTISLIGTYILIVTESSVSIAIVFYVIAVLVFLAYELLTTRKWGNLIKAMPLLVVVLILNLLVAGGVSLAKAGILNKEIIPERIRSVRILEQKTSPYDYLSNINAQVEMDDPQIKEIIAHAYKRETNAIRRNGYYESTAPTYEKIAAVTSGNSTAYYRLQFTEEELKLIGKRLSDSDAFKTQYLTLPQPLYDTMNLQLNNIFTVISNESLSQEQDKLLLDTLQDEVLGMGFESWYTYVNTLTGMTMYEDAPVAYIRYTEASEKQLQVAVPVMAARLPKTWKMLLDLLYENQDNALLEQILTKSSYQYSMDIAVHLADKNGMDEDFYLDSGDADKAYVSDLILEAIRSRSIPDGNGFLIVSGWWTEHYYVEQDGSWLLPVPDGIEIGPDGRLVIN